MVRNFIFLALIALAITIYALIECVRTRPNDVRSLPKAGWVLAIILLPLIGAALWFWLGRPNYGAQGPQSRSSRPSGGQKAPDDDEAFLRKLETQRRQAARAEELRRKEAELADRERKLLGDPDKKNDEGGSAPDESPKHTP
ncbi:PLD nuclease N-terminal domain-containing protein [Paeniglutamicibacter cryotolerans]|uniref:Cardiolipin synthase N-terminal domain-containing protein n=1 Tax=Paeniglutamicibacter cryotolerans TaxID=670079 RepID=A0A839QQ30_9MICC|nr:PLD nuclease N-terminal domain-containing protein [Paeniglutamicibacter cryotolerans]MBB2994191.1 hypothetical protein [Paeniglutamicibacter cryotolerans]